MRLVTKRKRKRSNNKRSNNKRSNNKRSNNKRSNNKRSNNKRITKRKRSNNKRSNNKSINNKRITKRSLINNKKIGGGITLNPVTYFKKKKEEKRKKWNLEQITNINNYYNSIISNKKDFDKDIILKDIIKDTFKNRIKDNNNNSLIDDPSLDVIADGILKYVKKVLFDDRIDGEIEYIALYKNGDYITQVKNFKQQMYILNELINIYIDEDIRIINKNINLPDSNRRIIRRFQVVINTYIGIRTIVLPNFHDEYSSNHSESDNSIVEEVMNKPYIFYLTKISIEEPIYDVGDNDPSDDVSPDVVSPDDVYVNP